MLRISNVLCKFGSDYRMTRILHMVPVLLLEKSSKLAALVLQVPVGSSFVNAPIFEDDNLIDFPQGTQPV